MPQKEKPSRKTFQHRLDEMVELLRRDILSGRLEADKYLPSEAELGKQFQLSNNSVRKGLELLVQEGMIEKIPKVGNRIVSPGPEGKTIVRFGYHSTINSETNIEYLLEEFHKRYPNIHVQTLGMPTNRYYTFAKEYMDANLLDIVTINDYNFQTLLEHDATDMLEPVENIPSQYSFLTKPFTVNGSQLVQPLIFAPLVLCYNREHFAQSGIPEPDSGWSWSELLEVAEKLAISNERYGFYFSMSARNRFPVFMLQSGMRFEPDERGNYTLADTKLINSLDVCKEILSMKNVFPATLSASDADAERLFLQGKVSIIMTTYAGLNYFKDADFSFDIAPVPYSHEYRTLMIIIGLAINRKSKVKDAAKLLSEFLTSYEAQLLIRKRTLSIPANKSAAEWKGMNDSNNSPSRYHMFRELIPTFRLSTDLLLSPSDLNIVLREAKLYWSGLHDKDTMCRNIEEALSESSKVKAGG